MRTANQIMAVVLWVIGIGMLCYQSEPVWGAAFFVPFALGPQFITHVGISRAKSTRSQAILMLALLSYFAWFIYVYVDAFYIHLDPQSAIALLFVGLYAAPAMFMLWLLAYCFEIKSRQRSGPVTLTPRP